MSSNCFLSIKRPCIKSYADEPLRLPGAISFIRYVSRTEHFERRIAGDYSLRIASFSNNLYLGTSSHVSLHDSIHLSQSYDTRQFQRPYVCKQISWTWIKDRFVLNSVIPAQIISASAHRIFLRNHWKWVRKLKPILISFRPRYVKQTRYRVKQKWMKRSTNVKRSV